MDSVFIANGLSKRYGSFYALKDFDMQVPRGSIYGFVGRNGAGKTTLIRLLCGLQTPSAGELTLFGASGNDKAIQRARRRMGAVVESPAVFRNLSARDNLEQQLQILGVPSKRSVDELLELVGLTGTGRKPAERFSLGMRQRLGLAVALAGNPDLLVLDEPVNGLDPQGIVEIRETLLRLNRDREITILISSHYLDELSRIATHYGFIDHGQMIREMNARELAEACSSCLEVTVSDTKALSVLLTERGMEHCIRSETEAEIYTPVEISELVHLLESGGCRLIHAKTRDENLETFFIKLVGGASNA